MLETRDQNDRISAKLSSLVNSLASATSSSTNRPELTRAPESLCAVAVALLVAGLTPGQAQVASSWDGPSGQPVSILEFQGGECVGNEAIIVLRASTEVGELVQAAEAMGDHVVGFIPRLHAARIVFGPRAELSDRLAAYANLAIVERALPNRIGRITEAGNAPVVPDDPDFPEQWHLENTGQSGGTADADLDASAAWSITRGSPQVVVAVLDTGIDIDGKEFAGRLLPGWDFLDEDPVPEGETGHGTKVAGLLGANADNGFEVAGVDHHCMILPIRVGSGLVWTDFNCAQGVDYATAQGADVMSMSFGFHNALPQLLDDAIAAAADSGAILVAAAGNEGSAVSVDDIWPAASEKTIAVGWTDHNDVRSGFSTSGNALDFMAPGVDVLTASFTSSGQPKLMSGSSASAPLVSGIAALMRSLNPSLTYEQVYAALVAGAEDSLGDPLDTVGWDPWYGYGRVNAAAALKVLCGCEGGESLIASPQHISVSASEVVALRVDAGREHAGQVYWIFGSASGPGAWAFGSMTLPIAADGYTRFTIEEANGSVLVDTHGVLDSAGQAMALLIFPEEATLPAPGVLSHVAVVFDGRAAPAHAALATDVTSTTLEP